MSLISAPDVPMLSADIAKYLVQNESLDSSVGIATRYGLDGPGIKSRWGRDFPHPSRPAPGPTPPPVQGVPGAKRLGRGVEHPRHLAPRLKKE